MTASDLQQFVRAHNLDEDAFAALVGVTKQAVDHWLRGRRKIPEPVARLVLIYGKYPGLMK